MVFNFPACTKGKLTNLTPIQKGTFPSLAGVEAHNQQRKQKMIPEPKFIFPLSGKGL
jgi:hypothetical protein